MEKEFDIVVVKDDNKSGFNWIALGLWIVSMIISLIPFYIDFFVYLANNNTIDLNFWQTDFVKSDVLWVFSTLLLFALIDSIVFRKKKEKTGKTIFKIIASVVFSFSEITWILFHVLSINKNQSWPLVICIVLIILDCIFVAPLKISFIKEG